MSKNENLSLLDLKGKVLFSDEMYSRKKLLSLLNGLLDNFTEKIFISKNDKVEAVILPLEEYEILKENYEEYTNKKFLSYNFVEIKKGK